MQKINGTALAQASRAELKELITKKGLKPSLAVLLVGDDQASALYVRLKKKAAEELGIKVEVEHLEASMPEAKLIELIQTWNRDPSIDAILVQLPLPSHFNEQAVIDAMDSDKDVDGFHPDNLAELAEGNAYIIPPVHEGILRLIGQTPVHINGARTVLIGNSEVFLKPLERLLKTAGAVVTRLTADQLANEALKEADIVISAVGKPEFITAKHVKDDAVLIDVGTTKSADDTVVGDFALKTFEDTDCWITPVPGGVGPMTIAQLLWNVYSLAMNRQEKE